MFCDKLCVGVFSFTNVRFLKPLVIAGYSFEEIKELFNQHSDTEEIRDFIKQMVIEKTTEDRKNLKIRIFYHIIIRVNVDKSRKEESVMYHLLYDRKSHFSRFFLCFLFIITLVVCTAYDKSEIEKLDYTGGLNSESTISSTDSEFYEIISNEITGYSVIKNIASKNSATGRHAGFRASFDYEIVNELFLLIGTCVLFILYFYRNLATSHHFIITYIHNLDGMKP